MKTIGQLLKYARDNKGYSLRRIEDITKIKASFIDAIEKEKWENLPPFPTILGFVKSISTALNIDEKMTVAILKRDYPPKKLNINPKPDVASKFSWSPKLTFAVGIGVFLFFIFGYLFFQYAKSISAPSLEVESPKDGQIIVGNSVLVFGKTDLDAKIVINNQPIIIDENGKFSVSIEVVPSTKEIDVVATSRSGKITEVKRQILVTSN
ncbi:MAG TPA: helix-turn-helix domain-containing protein [Patescibacteria group bacterium]|nr:helix-turn-helix domain-containing protein [Patescibacteria group bacterium]